jgi:hypothetical protein
MVDGLGSSLFLNSSAARRQVLDTLGHLTRPLHRDDWKTARLPNPVLSNNSVRAQSSVLNRAIPIHRSVCELETSTL